MYIYHVNRVVFFLFGSPVTLACLPRVALHGLHGCMVVVLRWANTGILVHWHTGTPAHWHTDRERDVGFISTCPRKWFNILYSSS